MVVVVVLEENEVAADPDQDQAEHFQRTATAYVCTNACTTPHYSTSSRSFGRIRPWGWYSCCITSWSVVVPAEKKEGFEGA